MLSISRFRIYARCFRLLLLSGVLFVMCGCTPSSSTDSLQLAEEYLREGRYDDAVRAYQTHMQKRLAIPKRPDWENPYFYELMIGDVYLAADRVPEALKMYESAERHGIHNSLVSDRYRAVATYFEGRGELRSAFDTLVTYRDRDSLLFDAMLDRIGRALTATESKAP